jgi:hypothetical protein
MRFPCSGREDKLALAEDDREFFHWHSMAGYHLHSYSGMQFRHFIERGR